MTRTIMIPAVLLALMAAAPAPAQEWSMVEFLASDLDDDKLPQAYAAAMAACLLGQGDAAATSALFTDAGWTLTAETEMGLNSIASQHEGLYVLAAADGNFCAAYSEETGTDVATSLLMQLVAFTGLGTAVAPGTSECTSLQLTPAIGIEVTSSGNDPVCEDAGTSQVRFTFAATE
jgi:hypothetical protein